MKECLVDTWKDVWWRSIKWPHREVPAAACRFHGLALGHLVSIVVSSGLNYSCLVSACWKDWTVAAGSCVVSACLEDWSAAAESSLVFATGLNCWQRRSSSLPKNYCWTGSLSPILITFLFHLCWVVGKRRGWTLIKSTLQKLYAYT